jgi:hypothetical protein
MKLALVIIAFIFAPIIWTALEELTRSYFNKKTKKVCDLCFRDIKKMNEYYKENKEELDRLLEEKFNK